MANHSKAPLMSMSTNITLPHLEQDTSLGYIEEPVIFKAEDVEDLKVPVCSDIKPLQSLTGDENIYGNGTTQDSLRYKREVKDEQSGQVWYAGVKLEPTDDPGMDVKETTGMELSSIEDQGNINNVTRPEERRGISVECGLPLSELATSCGSSQVSDCEGHGADFEVVTSTPTSDEISSQQAEPVSFSSWSLEQDVEFMPIKNQEQERPILDVASPVGNESSFPSTAILPPSEHHNYGQDAPLLGAIIFPPTESAVDTAAMDIDEPLNLTTTSPDADALLDADELLLRPTANEGPLPADNPPSRKRGVEDAMITSIDELTLLPVSSSALEEVQARVIPQHATDRPAKRRRIVLEAVELPTLVSIFGKRKIAVKQKTEESKEALKPLKNRKGTKKEDFTLSADTVWARLHPLGLSPFPIPVTKSILDFTASRQLFSKWYGGAMRSTFPDISRDNIELHGLNDFMFPNPLYNPHVPEVPGVPGLWYTVKQDPSVRRSNPWNKPEQRVIVLIKPGVWQYQGQYEMKATESLTKEEWAAQNPKVRDTWAESIHVTLWGRATRARIALRAQLGRAPTLNELKTALKTKDDFKTVLPAQINRALLRGEETMAVWTMKCVGYDTEFQKGLMKKFRSHPECAAKSRAKGAPKKEKAPKAPKKEREESNERGAGGLVDSDEVKPATSKRGAKYRPRGTRSRPN